MKPEHELDRETRLQNLESEAPAHTKSKVQKACGKPFSSRDGEGEGAKPGGGKPDNTSGNDKGVKPDNGNSGNSGGGNSKK